MVYVIVLSVIAGALGIYYFLFKDLNLFRKHDIPHIRPWPVVGNMGAVLLRKQSLVEFLKSLYNVNAEAKYIGTYEFTRPVLILRDPELIKSVAVKYFEIFPDHANIIRADQDPLFSCNLFSLRGERWREVRSLLSPAFTSSKLKGMFKLMSDCATDFGEFIAELPPEQRVMETKEVFTRYTNDVIASCVFGISVNSVRDPNNLFYVYGRKATNIVNFSTFVKFYMYQHLPLLAKILKLRFVPEEIAKFLQELVETTIKTRDEQGIVRPDILQLMMESRGKKEGGEDLTIKDMTGQAFIFFFAGFEATSTLISFVTREIAVNEDIQNRLHKEIDQVLEDTNGQASYNTVNNMEYMDAIVNETLRMYPASGALDRVCIKDFELPPALPGLKPYTIKKGQSICIPVYALHHDPKYFEEPEKFNPDRFLGEQKKHSINTEAYLPFGLGPRVCLGNRLAPMMIKALLFHLLARCDLLPCEKTSMPLELVNHGFIMKPKGGFWLKIVPRKNPHRTIAVNAVNGTQEM